jgi:hypothetical protein
VSRFSSHLGAAAAFGAMSLLLAQSPRPNTPSASAEPVRPTAPAADWVLPLFSDKEGWRTMTLRGSEFRPAADHVAVTNLNITIFSGKADAAVDSVLLSPDARFFQKEKRATGEKGVRFIRDDIEVNGTRWTYVHAAKKISLEKDVRVIFRGSQLSDILK